MNFQVAKIMVRWKGLGNLQLIRFPLCFGKGKICFVWKTWATLQFLSWEKLVNFFEIPTLPNQWGTYFWVGGCDLYSPSNYDEATRKFGIGRFGRFEFLGLTLSTLQSFHWRFRSVILKKDRIFSGHQLISWWVKDPPFPNLEIETFRFLGEISTPKHVPQLPAGCCEVVSCLPFGSLLDTVRGGEKKIAVKGCKVLVRWCLRVVNCCHFSSGV